MRWRTQIHTQEKQTNTRVPDSGLALGLAALGVLRLLGLELLDGKALDTAGHGR